MKEFEIALTVPTCGHNWLTKEDNEEMTTEGTLRFKKLCINYLKYRTIYQTYLKEYAFILDTTKKAIKKTELGARDRFRFNLRLQTEVKEAIFSRIKQEIPGITPENEEEYRFHPALIEHIYSQTEIA